MVVAQYNLDNAVLTAPFAGVVSQVSMSAGEQSGGNQMGGSTSSSASGGSNSSSTSTSNNGSSIVVIDPKSLRVEASIAEADIARVQVDQPVLLTFDALPGQPARGRVSARSPQSTTSSGVTSYLVIVAVDDAPASVLPGMTATVNVVYEQRLDALLVPNRALRRQGNDQVVDVLTPGGQIEARPVQRGMTNEQVTEITGGLAEGDQVVVSITGAGASAPSASAASGPGASAPMPPPPGGFGGPPPPGGFVGPPPGGGFGPPGGAARPAGP
jgi:multidrug efflux pump subunit AcrA (membrane-fusion protein)